MNLQRDFFRFSMNEIGVFLFCIYIFASFLGNDVVFPSEIGTYSLFLFLGYSIFFIAHKKILKITLIEKWTLLFMCFSLISMFYSPEKSILNGTYYFLIVNVILVLLLSQYDFTMKTIEKISWTYALSSATLIIMLIATGNIVDSSAIGHLGYELFGNANILATMLMISMLYTMWLLVYANNSLSRKCILFIVLVLGYYGMFLTGGRKYIVIPVVFLYILFLFKQDRAGRQHFIKYTFIIVAVAVSIYFLIMKIPMFYDIIGVRMEGLLAFVTGDVSSADSSSIIRGRMIQIGLDKWMQSPIWGYGFDSFKYYNQIVTGRFYYSHNNFVELLYNECIIGFVLYYWYYIRVIMIAWKRKAVIPQKTRAFVISAVLSMLVYEYGAINYTSTSTMILLCLISIMLGINDNSENIKV